MTGSEKPTLELDPGVDLTRPIYDQVRPVAVPEGWALVPLEATDEQVAEGALSQGGYDPLDLRAAYRSMVAARPALVPSPVPQEAEPVASEAIAKLIEHHRLDCSRMLHGQCSTRRCLVRGGWEVGDGSGYSKATCEALETCRALEKRSPASPPSPDAELLAALREARGAISLHRGAIPGSTTLLAEIDAALSRAPTAQAAASKEGE